MMEFPVLSACLNYLLRHDVQFSHQSWKADTQVLVIEIEDLAWSLSLTLRAGRLELSWGKPERFDAYICGRVEDYYHFISAKVKPSNRGLHIMGDPTLVQQWYKIWQDLDVDWQEIFAPYVGDGTVQVFARMVYQLRARFWAFNQAMQRNFTEYLQYELQVLPCPEEVNDFLDEVDELQMAVDRLSAKWALKSVPDDL